MTAATACPCGSGRAYPACCGPLHAGEPAPDAQALMRSRYSAYVREDAAYLLRTWQASTRPDTLDFAADARPTWLGLKVLSHQLDDADHARVAFVARYRIGGGSAVRMREHSRFVREHGQWRYLDAGGDAP